MNPGFSSFGCQTRGSSQAAQEGPERELTLLCSCLPCPSDMGQSAHIPLFWASVLCFNFHSAISSSWSGLCRLLPKSAHHPQSEESYFKQTRPSLPASSQKAVSLDPTSLHGQNKVCGQSQPMTGKLRNAGGASPPQMKPLNYHAINMQTSAKLGLNQISHWGPSGRGESSRRGARQGRAGWEEGCGIKRWASTGTQAPEGHSGAPRAPRVGHGAQVPWRGA